MEKSENYYLRKEYMKDLTIPTFSEIKATLGEPLGNAVIEECPEVLRKEMGTEPKLQGAGDTLWTSPSDLLEGLVVLKPPFTNRYIKALTHEGILSIGMIIEDKFITEMEQKCRNALYDQEEMLLFLAEQEKNKAVRDALAERTKYYEEKFENFENDFENRLQEELELLTVRLLKDNESLLADQKVQLEAEWQDRLMIEVEETTKRLTMRFLEDLERQEMHLTQKYSMELKKMEAKHEATLEMEQEICKETLKQLKHNLECKNISNLIYVLCMERRKCEQNRLVTEKQHEDIVAKLSNQIDVSEAAIKKLKDTLMNQQHKIVIRERCLKEILKQFQKFVYFALRAAPKQGEFLLNVEKLLLYELAETVSNIAKNARKTPFILPKRSTPQEDQLTAQDLTLPEYHNCLDEIDPPEDPSEELFSVIFNDKLYVREDFRNMISQGIEMRPSNELWNEDVEELIVALKNSLMDTTWPKKEPKRQSLPQLPTGQISPIPTVSMKIQSDSKVSPILGNSNNIPLDDQVSRPEHVSRKSSVFFVEKEKNSYVTPRISIVDAEVQRIQSNEQKLLTEMISDNTPSDRNTLQQIAQMRENTSVLLFAKDSLELHRMSLRTASLRNSFDTEQVMKAREKVLNEQRDRATCSIDSPLGDKQRDSPHRSPTLERIRRVNTDRAEKNNVDIKNGTEKFPNNLKTDITLSEAESLKRKQQAETDKELNLITPKDRMFAGLSVAEDSLEIIKPKALAKAEEVKQNFMKAIDDAIPNTAIETLPSASSIAGGKGRICITETAVEIDKYVPVKEEMDKSVPVFKPLIKTYRTGSIVVHPDQTWRVYEYQYQDIPNAATTSEKSKYFKYDRGLRKQQDNFIEKQNIAKIAGSEEYVNMSITGFSVDRVHSLLRMLKEDASLMRIFTACSR